VKNWFIQNPINKFWGGSFGLLPHNFPMEKPSLQSKLFPAEIPFSKIQKKNLAGKNLLCKGENALGLFKMIIPESSTWVE
jgi:hypothetical protein